MIMAVTVARISTSTTREQAAAAARTRARTREAAAVAARSNGASKDGGNSDQPPLVKMLLSRFRW